MSQIHILLGAVGFVVLIAVLVKVYRATLESNTAAIAREDQEAQEHHEAQAAEVLRGFNAGVCDRFGNPLCQQRDCSAMATRPRPMIGLSKTEARPAVQRANRLHGLPPKYSVEVEDDLHKLCTHHHRRAVEIFEFKLAEIRAKQAAFNAGIEADVSLINRRGIERALEESDRQIHDVEPRTVAPLLSTSLHEPEESTVVLSSESLS